MGYHDELIDLLISDRIRTKLELHRAKITLCKKYRLNRIPPDSELIDNLALDNLSEIKTYFKANIKKGESKGDIYFRILFDIVIGLILLLIGLFIFAV